MKYLCHFPAPISDLETAGIKGKIIELNFKGDSQLLIAEISDLESIYNTDLSAIPFDIYLQEHSKFDDIYSFLEWAWKNNKDV